MSDLEINLMVPLIFAIAFIASAIIVQNKGRKNNTSTQPLVAILYIVGILLGIGVIANML